MILKNQIMLLKTTYQFKFPLGTLSGRPCRARGARTCTMPTLQELQPLLEEAGDLTQELRGERLAVATQIRS